MFLLSLTASVLFAACETQISVTRKRIKTVENGLLRGVYLKGTNPEKLSLRERMAFYKVPGVSIAVMDKHREEWARAYGIRETGTGVPVTPETLFQGGNLSRPVAAAIALGFVAEGRLDLEEDLAGRLGSGRGLPASSVKAVRKISLNDLLNERSGLIMRRRGGYSRSAPLPDLSQILGRDESPVKQPGRGEIFEPETIGDADAGAVLVQRLLEDLTGKPFSSIAKESVLGPLDMGRSTFEIPLPGGLENEAAAGHLRDGGLVEGKWLNYPDSAAGGLWTTPRDYAAFLMEITREAMGGSSHLLSSDLARTLLSPQAGGRGFGFSFEGSGDDTFFSVSGKTCGYSSSAVFFPSKGQGVVIMTNSDNGAFLAEEIMRAVSLAYGWPFFKPQEKPLYRLDPSVYQDYEGSYEITPDYVLEIVWQDYYLLVRPTGQAETKFYAESQTVFFSVDPFVRIQFKRDDRGDINGLALWQQDFEQRARKIL